MSVHLPNNNNGDLDVLLSGKFEPSRDELDCIAVFDGTGFRLEVLAGQMATRWAPAHDAGRGIG